MLEVGVGAVNVKVNTVAVEWYIVGWVGSQKGQIFMASVTVVLAKGMDGCG